MAIRYLVNDDGRPFDDAELSELTKALDSLNQGQRKEFRDANASEIATHPARRILVVSGPGTGKSTLFKQRILFWLSQNPTANILALSFVRKLVAELDNDIRNDATLDDAHKSHVDVHTLHKYARSIVEQNHGTQAWRFEPHFRVIGQIWKAVVWEDVISLAKETNRQRYSWRHFEKQLHDNRFDDSYEWKKLRDTYFTLCQFHNAAGFSDLILRARDALIEQPGLNKHQLFIFDEYQDFNASEEALLEQLTGSAKGILLAGDDDQVLYETLKSSKASLIRAIYGDAATANAMLPLCSRCDFHITRAASHFAKQSPDADCIKKIYEPISEESESLKAQVVGCATPTTAVDYIRRVIEELRAEIDVRREELAEGKAKDPFVLILSPTREIEFYKLNGAQQQLFSLIEAFRAPRREYSDEYYKLLTYYSLANYPADNFTFRKALYYEEMDESETVSLLESCLESRKPFATQSSTTVRRTLDKAIAIRNIMDSPASIEEKLPLLSTHIHVTDAARLRMDLEQSAIDRAQLESVEHQNEEQAELEELEVKEMSAVELMTIVGSKGLSADHVIIIGFDDVNMRWITRNAFYVAMTRARRSLHLITALKSGGAMGPDEFLDDLPDENLAFSKYTKSKRERTGFGSRAEFRAYLSWLADQKWRSNPPV